MKPIGKDTYQRSAGGCRHRRTVRPAVVKADLSEFKELRHNGATVRIIRRDGKFWADVENVGGIIGLEYDKLSYRPRSRSVQYFSVDGTVRQYIDIKFIDRLVKATGGDPEAKAQAILRWQRLQAAIMRFCGLARDADPAPRADRQQQQIIKLCEASLDDHEIHDMIGRAFRMLMEEVASLKVRCAECRGRRRNET